MKKSLLFILAFTLLAYTGFSQLQATLKPGSAPNSVYVAIRSATTLSDAKFSSFQVAVAIPSSVSAGLSATIVSLNPLMNFPLAEVTTETQGGTSYTAYSFSGDGNTTSTGTTYAAGVETNYAEIFFTGGNVVLNDVRLIQIPGGGVTLNVNFYVANLGSDITNLAAQFYSNVPTSVSNDGNGYNGSSFVTIGAVVVPVKFLGFNVIKKDNNALINWSVENETEITQQYEILRSGNGVDFKSIATVAPKNNANPSNTYEFSDALSAVRSTGIVYYRIKQVDKDGKNVLTSIAKIRLDGKALAISVSPNPIRNIANLSLDLVENANVKVTITDAGGKQVQNIPMQLFKGLNIKKINMDNLAAGNYTMQVQTGTEVKTLSLVKVN